MSVDRLCERINTMTEIIRNKASERDVNLPLQLWNNIVDKSKSDSDYGEKLNQWLSGEKSTVFFRDEICFDFEYFAYDSDVQSQVLNHDNAWIPLDSWVSQLRSADKKNLPNITLGDGAEFSFSYFTNFDVPVYESLSEQKLKLCILDDEMYTITREDEPCFPLKKEFQPEIFKDYSYNFFEGEFIKRDCDIESPCMDIG